MTGGVVARISRGTGTVLDLGRGSSTIETMFEGLPGRLGTLRKVNFEGGNPL